jgi:hypothetical protein
MPMSMPMPGASNSNWGGQAVSASMVSMSSNEENSVKVAQAAFPNASAEVKSTSDWHHQLKARLNVCPLDVLFSF